MNRLTKCPFTVFCSSLLEEYRGKLFELEKNKRDFLYKIEGILITIFCFLLCKKHKNKN